jgi:hypothetical protein
MTPCVFCQGMLDPATQRCQACGRVQPAPLAANPDEAAETLTTPCPTVSPTPSRPRALLPPRRVAPPPSATACRG